MNDDVEKKLEARAKASGERAEKMPPSVQYAIIRILPNILNGCFWGFTDMEDIKEHIDALKSDGNIVARKLGNACLLETNPKFFISAVKVIDKNAINKKDVDVMQKKIAEAEYDFEKFLVRSTKEGKFGGTIGIYCVNDTTTISYRGVRYPAFRVDAARTIKFLSKYNYMIKVKGKYVPASSVDGKTLFEAMNLSPTNTGLFIDIVFNGGAAMGKKFNDDFKARYAKK